MKNLIFFLSFCLSFYGSYGQWSTSGTNINNSNTGYVGIGTSSPAFKLDVRGDIYTSGGLFIDGGDLILKRTTATYGYIVRPNLTGYKKLEFAVQGGGPLEDLLANADHSYFTGNVGIGTFDPGTYRLAVEGTIGARKVKVTQAAWADYVFENDYALPSLSEVETFIQLHKHLPGVPSAREIEKGGLDLGDNQAILLKKIEELTLYLLEQNKKTEQLIRENRELRARIDKIDQKIDQ